MSSEKIFITTIKGHKVTTSDQLLVDLTNNCTVHEFKPTTLLCGVSSKATTLIAK